MRLKRKSKPYRSEILFPELRHWQVPELFFAYKEEK